MAEPVIFPGAAYDDGRANAMADAIGATFGQAAVFSVTTYDQLAALGIAAARVIMHSPLEAHPDQAAGRLAAFVVAWAARIRASREPGPP